MGYVEKSRRKAFLLAGFVGMFLCGIGDILFSFRGEGVPKAISGIISMNISEVPLIFYQLSFFIGIIAMVGYWLGSRAMYSYIKDSFAGEHQKLLKTYGFGAVMMSLGIFGIHSICTMAVIALRAAAGSGLTPEQIDEHFTVLVMPFMIGTAWQTIADLLVAVTYIIMVVKKLIPVSKKWLICGPVVLYVIFNIIKALLTAATDSTLLPKLFSGGETWGLSFMFLAMYFAVKKDTKQ